MSEFQVLQGDSRILLPPVLAQQKKKIAFVTDPPYHKNMDPNYGRFIGYGAVKERNFADINTDTFDPNWLLGLSKKLCIWGYPYFADKLPIASNIVWIKKRDSKIGKFAFGDAEIAWITSGQIGVYAFFYEWDGYLKAEKTIRCHPTQKPVELFAWCIRKLKINPDEYIVVDPYLGSGACGIAALRLGYDFIGCEITEEYAAIATKNITENLLK